MDFFLLKSTAKIPRQNVFSLHLKGIPVWNLTVILFLPLVNAHLPMRLYISLIVFLCKYNVFWTTLPVGIPSGNIGTTRYTQNRSLAFIFSIILQTISMGTTLSAQSDLCFSQRFELPMKNWFSMYRNLSKKMWTVDVENKSKVFYMFTSTGLLLLAFWLTSISLAQMNKTNGHVGLLLRTSNLMDVTALYTVVAERAVKTVVIGQSVVTCVVELCWVRRDGSEVKIIFTSKTTVLLSIRVAERCFSGTNPLSKAREIALSCSHKRPGF